jgi:hypothetical protein
MKPGSSDFPTRFFRYSTVLLKQALTNRDYLYYWLIATLLDVGLTETSHQWGWLLIASVNFLVGVAAIASVVRPVDRAFASLPLDFQKGYGPPIWIVQGKEPLQQEILRVRAAGYSAEDYEKFAGQLSSRLCQPIKEVRKPSAKEPVIEVILKRQSLPDSVSFDELPLQELSQGEFFIGKSADKIEKLSLSKMVHMLVAGETGAGKTQFMRQFLATVVTQTRNAHVALIDMKGGIDFQSFLGIPNFEIVSDYDSAELMLDQAVSLYEKRRDFILQKKKSHWNEFQLKELEKESAFEGKPLGPVLIVVDELAELSKKATEKSSKSELQGKLATLARLSRFTAIHLVLGTQRPDKSTIDMQSKDNLPTRICFSVPSVSASTLVIGDMTASTLGHRPGRAVFQLSGSQIVQTPLITNPRLDGLMEPHAEKMRHASYRRGILTHAWPSQGETKRRIKLK